MWPFPRGSLMSHHCSPAGTCHHNGCPHPTPDEVHSVQTWAASTYQQSGCMSCSFLKARSLPSPSMGPGELEAAAELAVVLPLHGESGFSEKAHLWKEKHLPIAPPVELEGST